MKPDFLTRALAGLSPARARRRMAERLAYEQLAAVARGYDAAGRGRRFANWRAPATSANAEVEVAAEILRARSRDLVRNNPLAANGVQVLTSNIVGTGITPRAATAVPAFNAQVDRLFADWSRRCDWTGQTDFHGLVALAVREMIEGGDVFVQRRWLRKDGARVPLALEIKEAEHLDAARVTIGTGGAPVAQGIEYDDSGRRSAYWMFPEHPGDHLRNLRLGIQSVRVPAAEVIHLFERQRTQDRGVPWLAPVMGHLRDIDDYNVAELTRKKTEACLVGVIRRDTDEAKAAAEVTVNGETVHELRPGMLGVLTGADGIEFNQPSATPNLGEWHRTQATYVSAGLRVPYALLTGDLSQANFSSNRAGLNEFRRFVTMVQWHLVIPLVCQRIWDWFIEAAQTAGQLPEGPVAVEWDPPGFESVNPLQDANADAVEVRNGFASTPQKIGKRGYNPARVIAEQAAYLASLDATGQVSDADPRKVTKGGQAQQDGNLEAQRLAEGASLSRAVADLAGAMAAQPAPVVNVDVKAPDITVTTPEVRTGPVYVDINAAKPRGMVTQKRVTGYDAEGRILAIEERQVPAGDDDLPGAEGGQC